MQKFSSHLWVHVQIMTVYFCLGCLYLAYLRHGLQHHTWSSLYQPPSNDRASSAYVTQAKFPNMAYDGLHYDHGHSEISTLLLSSRWHGNYFFWRAVVFTVFSPFASADAAPLIAVLQTVAKNRCKRAWQTQARIATCETFCTCRKISDSLFMQPGIQNLANSQINKFSTFFRC